MKGLEYKYSARLMTQVVGCLLLLASFAVATPAVAKGFEVCNKSNEKLSVAIGFFESSSWKTKGWYGIERNSCKTLHNQPAGKTFYVYAEGNRSSIWSGKYNLCIHPRNAFEINGFKNCASRGYKKVQFNQVEVAAQYSSYSYSLTGGKRSKIDSLDIGDGVYVQGFFSDELSYIVRIDHASNQVKVRSATKGTTRWVAVSQILSEAESTVNDLGRTAIVIGGLYCMFNPNECSN